MAIKNHICLVLIFSHPRAHSVTIWIAGHDQSPVQCTLIIYYAVLFLTGFSVTARPFGDHFSSLLGLKPAATTDARTTNYLSHIRKLFGVLECFSTFKLTGIYSLITIALHGGPKHIQLWMKHIFFKNNKNIPIALKFKDSIKCMGNQASTNDPKHSHSTNTHTFAPILSSHTAV